MSESLVLLRELAGVMFWGLVDITLGVVWVGIAAGVIWAVVKGFRDAD